MRKSHRVGYNYYNTVIWRVKQCSHISYICYYFRVAHSSILMRTNSKRDHVTVCWHVMTSRQHYVADFLIMWTMLWDIYEYQRSSWIPETYALIGRLAITATPTTWPDCRYCIAPACQEKQHRMRLWGLFTAGQNARYIAKDSFRMSVQLVLPLRNIICMCLRFGCWGKYFGVR